MNQEIKQSQEEKFTGYISLDLQNKIYQQKALNLAENLKLKKPKILDLACADGSFAAFAAKSLNGEPHGLDLPAKNIHHAKKLGVRAKVHDLSKPFPYRSSQFDLVFALEIIEHLYDTDQFLTQIHHLLKPHGYLILSTPNLASLNNRLRLLLGLYPKYLEYSTKGAGHIHLYTLPVLVNQLQKHHFKLKIATSPNFICPFITKKWFPKPLRSLFMALGDLFPSLGSHLLILARK